MRACHGNLRMDYECERPRRLHFTSFTLSEPLLAMTWWEWYWYCLYNHNYKSRWEFKLTLKWLLPCLFASCTLRITSPFSPWLWSFSCCRRWKMCVIGQLKRTSRSPYIPFLLLAKFSWLKKASGIGRTTLTILSILYSCS